MSAANPVTQGAAAATDAARPAPRLVAAYGARAEAYARGQGRLAATPTWQLQLLSEWAAQHDGTLLDLGAGPGHLTEFLHEHGRTISGIDPVPEFVAIARRDHPGIAFEVGDASGLPASRYTGVLAWFSLIHLAPSALRVALQRVFESLQPGGGLLLSVFTGPRLETFAHPMAPAFTWPMAELEHLLESIGFEADAALADALPRLGQGFVAVRRPVSEAALAEAASPRVARAV